MCAETPPAAPAQCTLWRSAVPRAVASTGVRACDRQTAASQEPDGLHGGYPSECTSGTDAEVQEPPPPRPKAHSP